MKAQNYIIRAETTTTPLKNVKLKNKGNDIAIWP